MIQDFTHYIVPAIPHFNILLYKHCQRILNLYKFWKINHIALVSLIKKIFSSIFQIICYYINIYSNKNL